MLATTKASKLFMLSATVEKYHQVFWLRVLKVKPQRMIEFLGARELFKSSAVNQVQVDHVSVGDMSAAISILLDHIQAIASTQLIVLFLEEHNSYCMEKIKAFAKKK